MTSEVIDAAAPAAQDAAMQAFTKTVLVLVGWLSFAPVLAQPARAPSDDASAAEAIKRVDHAWADAMIAGDLDKLNQIVADEWIEGYPGKASTKSTFLADVKSGHHKLVACDFGPAEVKVFGNLAVLQGSVTETRLNDGQRTTFSVAYMDVWTKRADRWVVIRSFAKKL